MAFDGIVCCDMSEAAKPHPLVLGDPRGEHYLYMVVVSTIFCFYRQLLRSDGRRPCEVMAKKHYVVMDLMSICRSHCLIPHSVISSFGVAPRGFNSKAYCKGLHSQIIQSWNNECIK
jgi:hypothetical protein